MAVENGNAPDTKKQKLDLDGQEIEKQLAMVEAISKIFKKSNQNPLKNTLHF